MKNTTWRGYFAVFFPHDFLWPFQLFNNLLAEVQLSIIPQQRSGKISISCSQKQKGERRLLLANTFSFHLRQQQSGISEKNSWPWVTMNQLFVLSQLQATDVWSFPLLKNLWGENMLRVLESSKLLQRPATCWDIQVKLWHHHRERAWETEIREPPVNDSNCMKIGQTLSHH